MGFSRRGVRSRLHPPPDSPSVFIVRRYCSKTAEIPIKIKDSQTLLFSRWSFYGGFLSLLLQARQRRILSWSGSPTATRSSSSPPTKATPSASTRTTSHTGLGCGSDFRSAFQTNRIGSKTQHCYALGRLSWCKNSPLIGSMPEEWTFRW